MNAIESKIYKLITDKFGVEEPLIKQSTSFYNDLDVDSLDFFELIANVEKAFEISIPDEQFEKLNTVGALTTYVSQLVNTENTVKPGVHEYSAETEMAEQ